MGSCNNQEDNWDFNSERLFSTPPLYVHTYPPDMYLAIPDSPPIFGPDTDIS